jgi:hypothetical protein
MTMKIRTQDLTGSSLDWAVMLAQGWTMPITAASSIAALRVPGPATDWKKGGPIIERERITLVPMPNGTWQSAKDLRPHFHNPTPLIAAMRAFVFARLGDEVEVPDQLINKED